MKTVFTFLLTFILLLPSIAQNSTIRCNTDHYHSQIMQSDPAYATHYNLMIQKRDAMLAEKGPCPDCSTPLILPLYFHFDQAMNACLPDLVQSQVDALNLDYTGNNPDINNFCDIDQDFPAGTLAGDGACIQFCVVGIDYNVAQNDPKPNQVINIWVGNAGGGVLGFSPLFGGANGDQIVVSDCAFGTLAPGCTTSGPGMPACGGAGWQYNLGRTLTHEMGHYMGLEHPWGGAGGCADDDGVLDTPTSDQPYYGCPAYPSATCGSTDLTMQFMDYVDDACMYMFTCDQASIMYNHAASLNVDVTQCTIAAPGLVYDGDPCADMPPVASFTVAPNPACVGETVTFTNTSAFSPNTASWNFGGGGAGTSTDLNPTTVYTSPGTYTITLDVSNALGSNSTTGQITITDAANPVFSYGTNSICTADPGNPSPTTGGTNGGTFTADNGLVINANTGVIDSAQAAAGQTYNITYTTTQGTCVVSHTETVTIAGLDDASINFPSNSFCVDNMLEQAQVNTGGGVFSASNGLIIDANTGEILLSSGIVGNTYSIYYATGGNCANNDSTTIQFVGSNTASFVGLQAGYCFTDAAFTLTADPPGGTFTIDDGSGPVAAAMFDPTSYLPGNFVTIEYSVVSGPCTATATQMVGIGDPAVVAASAEAAPSQSQDVWICPGETYPLIARGGEKYQWDVTVPGLSCYSCPDPVASPATSGPHLYTVNITDEFGCGVQLPVIVNVYNETIIDLGPDQSLYFGESFLFSPDTINADTIIWSTLEGIQDVAVTPFQVIPTQDILYIATAIDTHYNIELVQIIDTIAMDTSYVLDTTRFDICQDTDTLFVNYLGCQGVDIANAFSPNGDAINDQWYLFVNGPIELEEISVYNRWGQIVYSETDPNLSWDGTFKGKPQPIGNYVYSLRATCNGERVDRKGTLTLIR